MPVVTTAVLKLWPSLPMVVARLEKFSLMALMPRAVAIASFAGSSRGLVMMGTGFNPSMRIPVGTERVIIRSPTFCSTTPSFAVTVAADCRPAAVCGTRLAWFSVVTISALTSLRVSTSNCAD